MSRASEIRRAGLDVRQLVFGEVAAHAAAQALGLADVDHPPAGVLVQVHAGRAGAACADFFAEIHRNQRVIINYVTLGGASVGVGLVAGVAAERAQKAARRSRSRNLPRKTRTCQEKDYGFNPLQAAKEVQIGNFYFKKGSYRAAAQRFREATRWNAQHAEAWLRLAEAPEKLKDPKAAREAYAKYLELEPEAKNAAQIRSKLAEK